MGAGHRAEDREQSVPLTGSNAHLVQRDLPRHAAQHVKQAQLQGRGREELQGRGREESGEDGALRHVFVGDDHLRAMPGVVVTREHLNIISIQLVIVIIYMNIFNRTNRTK